MGGPSRAADGGFGKNTNRVGTRPSFPGSRRIRAWYQSNNECAPIPNTRCSVTAKRHSIDE